MRLLNISVDIDIFHSLRADLRKVCRNDFFAFFDVLKVIVNLHFGASLSGEFRGSTALIK